MVDGPNENVNVNENNNDVNINPADNVIDDQGADDQQGADDHQDNAFADLSIPMASNQEELTEERKQQRIKFLENTLADLKKQKSSLREETQDRLKLITQYENELLALRPMDEFVLESNKRAADARKRAEEKERLKREQEEINQRVANDANEEEVDNNAQLGDFFADIDRAGERARQQALNRDHLNDILNRRNQGDADVIQEEQNEDDGDNDEQNEQELDARNNDNVADHPQNNVQPQPIARRPVTDLFGNVDDDDEAEFDFNSNENIIIKAPQVKFAPPVNQQNGADQNNAQGAPNEEVANRGDNNANNPPRVFTDEEKRAQDERMAEVMQNFRQNIADLDAEEEAEKQERRAAKREEKRLEQQQPQPIARRPVTDLFGNGDDDDEAEFDPFAAHENPQVVLQMPVVNAEHQNEPPNEVVENNPQQENPPQENPPRELTEEERQRRAADDARMAQIAENFRKNMADIDAEEAAEKKARKEAKRLEKEKPVAPIYPQETNEFFGMLDNIGEAFEVANADIEKEKEIEKSGVRTNVYRDAIKSYRDMYKVDVDENEFAATVTEAFDMIKSDDVATSKKGQQMLKDYYKGVLKKAYDAEKATSYADHRIPDFVDVGRSTNNLLRAAMYSYTDVYHNNESGRWFDKTANGGLDAKELTELTQGDSLWSMDQKSDEAWEKQSRAAKDLANEWLKEDRPYEKMIQELNTLAEQARTSGMVGSLETMNKLMAAEWMLTNNPKMMVDDPEDPYNTIPNWGNKYWKAISATRDAIGISKHTSMRDLVQNDYAAAARAVNSAEYNKVQFEDHVFERNVREIYDSKELQAKQFAIQSAAAHLNEEESKIKINELTKIDENKVQISVRECDEKVLWESQPKSSFIDKLLIDKPKETEKESKDKDKEKDKGNAPNL